MAIGVWNVDVSQAPAATHVLEIVLLQILDAGCCDAQAGTVAAHQEVLLHQEPCRELQVFARRSGKTLQFGGKQHRRGRLHAAPRVESLEQSEAQGLLRLEVVLSLRGAGEQPPLLLHLGLMDDVVLRPFLRIAEHGIRLVEPSKQRRIAGPLIVRMIAARQEPEDALDQLDVGVRADLEHFVVVNVLVLVHKCLPLDPRFTWVAM